MRTCAQLWRLASITDVVLRAHSRKDVGMVVTDMSWDSPAVAVRSDLPQPRVEVGMPRAFGRRPDKRGGCAVGSEAEGMHPRIVCCGRENV